MKFLLSIPISLFIFSCGEKADFTTDSPLEKNSKNLTVYNLSVNPDTVNRYTLPISSNLKKLDFSITGNMIVSEPSVLRATLTFNQISTQKRYQKNFDISVSSGNNLLNLTSSFLLDNKILLGSTSSLTITDGKDILFSQSPIFNISNDAVVSLQIDSVIFNPINQVKIGERLTIRAYLSYSEDPKSIKQVAYTGKKPDGTDLTPATMVITNNRLIHEIIVSQVPQGTLLGNYTRTFEASDEFGNKSNKITIIHSVVAP